MKKYFLILLLLPLLPLSARAFLVPPAALFGGLVTAVIPCGCPPFGVAVSYAPLWLGAPLPVVGNIYYPPPPSAIIFQFFQFPVPGTFDLGGYLPGGLCRDPDPAQVAAGDPDPCDPGIIIPTIGTFRYTGTSSLSPLSEFSGL